MGRNQSNGWMIISIMRTRVQGCMNVKVQHGRLWTSNLGLVKRVYTCSDDHGSRLYKLYNRGWTETEY